MAIAIRELKAEDYDAVVTLCAQHGCGGDGRAVTADTLRHLTQRCPGLALVAVDDDAAAHAVTAVVLVDEGRGSADLTLHMVLSGGTEGNGPLASELLDRALGKAASQGIRKCRVRMPDGQDARPFWDRSRWMDWPVLGRPSSASQSAHAMVQRLTREADAAA